MKRKQKEVIIILLLSNFDDNHLRNW